MGQVTCENPEFTNPNSCNASRLKPEQDGALHVWNNTRDGGSSFSASFVKLSGVSGATLARRTVPAIPWESSVVCKIAMSEQFGPGVIVGVGGRAEEQNPSFARRHPCGTRQAQGVSRPSPSSVQGLPPTPH